MKSFELNLLSRMVILYQDMEEHKMASRILYIDKDDFGKLKQKLGQPPDLREQNPSLLDGIECWCETPSGGAVILWEVR